MTYNEFQTNLVSHLNKFTSPGVSVRIQLIRKNNAVDKIGLVLHDENEPNEMVSPIVYPDQLYEAYQSGTPMEELTELAWKVLHVPLPPEIGFKILEDKDYILGHAVLRLVGKQMNEERLKDAFFREFLDFAITIGILVRDGRDSYGMVMLTREAFESLEMNEAELLQKAADNSAAFFGDQLLDMNRMLHMPGENAEIDPEHLKKKDHAQYILTNRKHYYGAGAMLYTDKLRKLAVNLDRNLLILPSSIHEIVVIPESGMEDISYLQSLVRNVNQGEMCREEILTDSVYRYSLEKNSIELAEPGNVPHFSTAAQ